MLRQGLQRAVRRAAVEGLVPRRREHAPEQQRRVRIAIPREDLAAPVAISAPIAR